MKDHKSLLIPALCLVLAAAGTIGVCGAENLQVVAKKNVTKSDVRDDGDLTKRELKDISNNLNDISYYGFLLSDYDDPKYIDWNEVFYNGAGFDMGANKKVKAAYLKATGDEEIYTDLTVVSGEDVRDYVKQTTGLSYSKMKEQLDWVYIKDQDVYCFEHGDTNQVTADVISGSVKDGVYTIRYTIGNLYGSGKSGDEHEICFTMGDEYYCFISNGPVKGSGTKSDYILPDSDTRYLGDDDLEGMDAVTLRRARNEIYARHGRQFKDKSLQSYFESKSWYRPSKDPDSKIEKSLNKYEKANVKFISSYEDSSKKSSKNKSKGSAPKSSGYTDAELCKMAQDYYERHNGFRPPISEVDGTNGDIVTIHLYEIVGDHTATSAWYDIDRKSAKGTDTIFGDPVDLNK